MKFVGLLSILCVVCFAVTFLAPTEAKLKKIKIAKKVAKLLLLRGAIRPKVIMALPLPLPVPIPIIRKTFHSPISNSGWDSAPVAHPTTSYEIPSLSSLPESILSILRPALSTIAASAALKSNNQAWGSLPALDSWSPQIESWPSSSPTVSQNAWPATNNVQQQQQQQEVVEQQQTNNYA